MEHTKLPLSVNVKNVAIADTGDYDGVTEIIDADGKMLFQNWNGDDHDEERACRIVACVNACAGIPTDVLGLPNSIADKIESVASELLAVKRNRDALEIIAVCTAGALEKAGLAEIDNPADAIEFLVQQRDGLLDALKKCRGQWIHSVNAKQCQEAIDKADAQ